MKGISINSRVDDELEQGCGYNQDFCFQKNELQQIFDLVQEQWLDRIRKICQPHAKQFSDTGILQYHTLAHLLDHRSAWVKEARILPRYAVDKIRNMSLIKKLEEEYGPIIIVDEENIGYEEIDWRLVRPNQPSDVGPFHADAWFLALGHGIRPPKNMKAVKVWVAICCEPGLNGLKVVPNSQKKEWRYHGEFRHTFVKPQIDEDEASLPSLLLNTKPGDAVLFHDKLLHTGALNRGLFTRVSIEFMIFVQILSE